MCADDRGRRDHHGHLKKRLGSVSPLREKIIEAISASGHITLYTYMRHCLYDDDYGYYRRAQIIGGDGDFITAPEISQMFGEIIGLWLADHMMKQNLETGAILAEIGPGRGVLMADLTRGWQAVGFSPPPIHLIETSPQLRKIATGNLAEKNLVWHDRIEDLPHAPLFLVANEFFDALPIHQFTRLKGIIHERGVVVENDTLAFKWIRTDEKKANLPPDFTLTDDDTIIEFASDAAPIINGVASRINQHGGAALIIDYGSDNPQGDTLQSVRHHCRNAPLASPGEADLTSWVDFDHLSRVVKATGALALPLITQGEFLRGNGLIERAENLARGKTPARRRKILSEVDRLIGVANMGEVFKVMAILPCEA